MVFGEYTDMFLLDGHVVVLFFFFFQAEDGIRDGRVTGVQTCALPISLIEFFYKPVAFDPKAFDKVLKAPGAKDVLLGLRSEERRVGKGVDLGGRRIIKKKKKRT